MTDPRLGTSCARFRAIAMADAMFDAVRAKEIAALASLVSSPPTEADMTRHITKIKGLITEKKSWYLSRIRKVTYF